MSGDAPPPDVERQVVDGREQESIAREPVKAEEKDKKDGPFKRFLSGPYFDVIPAQYERIANAQHRAAEISNKDSRPTAEQPAGEDYLERLKSIVVNPVDVDGKYGLKYEELVPLPFDVPKWHAYLVDILSGVYMVAQATIVMFIAIYVENQERSWKSGRDYTKSWYPLVKALIIVYPLVTLIILVSLTVEYCIRKFMYFRLLSMRILVDWSNLQPWRTIFFYYFVATWILMNAWAIYGVAKYYNQNGNDGVDPVSFGTFVVVNLQTVQLLLYYFKVLSTETRLVSLNQIFERAPIEAQRLLEYTYVIEEQDLMDECYTFAVHSQRIFGRRLLNIMTCCMAAKDWHSAERNVCFDIERLKSRAPNRNQVDHNVQDLLEEIEKAAKGGGNEGAAQDADAVQLQVDGVGRHLRPVSNVVGPDVTADGRPPEMPAECLSGCGLRPLKWLYQNWYASLHSMHASVLYNFHTWPFRPDIPYFRMLTLVQLVGVVAVGAIVVLGWLYTASSSNCSKATKTCNNCLSVHERYFASNEPVCLDMETAIAGIVASANGTWNNNGVIQERYCNWACYGSFTPNEACPALN